MTHSTADFETDYCGSEEVTNFLDTIASGLSCQCTVQDDFSRLLEVLDRIDAAYVSGNDKADILARYEEKLGKDQPILSCACCGKRGFQVDEALDFSTITLQGGFGHAQEDEQENASSVENPNYTAQRVGRNARSKKLRHSFRDQLRITNIELEPAWRLQPDEIERWRVEQCIHSRFYDRVTGEPFALHQELVHQSSDGTVRFEVCNTCLTNLNTDIASNTYKGKPSHWYALCNGFDFGLARRVSVLPPPNDGFGNQIDNLPKLSLPEKIIIAKVRMCMALLKASDLAGWRKESDRRLRVSRKSRRRQTYAVADARGS